MIQKNFFLQFHDAWPSHVEQLSTIGVEKHFQHSQDSPADIHLQGKVNTNFIVLTQIIQHGKEKKADF